MRNLLPIFLISCLCIFIGCLGVGNSGSGIKVPDPNQPDSILAAGRIFFADRQLYGGIPVSARNQSGVIVDTVLTDTAGNFAFTQLSAGIYDFIAQTGDSEVTFARNVAVDGVNNRVINTTPLLGVKNVIIDEISSTSFHVKFHSNRASRASIEYGPLGGYQQTKTIGQAGQTVHEATLSGLKTFTDYEITLFLTGDDGQDFILHGLTAATTGAVGPTGLSVAINEGAYEARSNITTLFLGSSNSTHMRISENFDMSDTPWVSYSPTYAYTFKNTSPGTKRVYVQFRDANGITSPVQSDSILFSINGYLGIWLNNGVSTTNKTNALLSIMFPGAKEMQLSDNPNFLFSYKEPYTTSKAWKLTGSDGQKNVFCRFFGGLADPTEVFTASILLDTTAPEVEMRINNGNLVTASTNVTVTFSFSTPPVQMKLANASAPSSVAAWIPFKDSLSWTLAAGDGKKTVYAVFRDSAGNEYGPISAEIEMDTVAPLGNTIAVHRSEDVTSDIATFALVAELPIFLHFDAADTTTQRAYYAVGKATRPESFTIVPQPFSPVQLTEGIFKASNGGNTAVGTYTIWAYFTDQAGNAGFDQTVNVKIDGPIMTISPAEVSLKSAQEQLFTVSTKNIDPLDVGTVKWQILEGSGTIDTSGLFVAPAPVYFASQTKVYAFNEDKSKLDAIAVVNLLPSIEMLFLQRNGKFDYLAPDDQVAPGDSITAQVKIIHSNSIFEVVRQPAYGTVSVSPLELADFGSVATLTYFAPPVAPTANTVTIGIRSIDNRAAAATLTYLISAGANIVLSPTSGEAQRNMPLNISATVSGTASTTMTWTISPPGIGSFKNDDPNASTATTIPTSAEGHSVTFFASTPSQIKQASVTASIGGKEKRCNVVVYPPIKFNIEPVASTAMPIVAPMTFSIPGFDYLLGNATEAVIWEFKNQARTDFMPADGKTNPDRGSLTVIDATTAEYRRPSKLPSESDPTTGNTVIIRATSVSDPEASATAIVNISEKVEVKIFDTVEKANQITHKATVAEVGKIQFFASVTPTVIGNTSLSWTVNGTQGSTQNGFIDSNGLYTAPDIVINEEVTVRATSNYDPSAFAEVVVKLSDFWMPVRTNMFDATTSETMPINSMLINPYTASGSDFIVYAGTRGYGVWVATFSDIPGIASGGYWQPISNLSAATRSSLGQFSVGHMVIDPQQRVYAATADGIWFIPEPYVDGRSAMPITGNSPENNPPNENFLKLAFDTKRPQYLFATTPGGVYRLTIQNETECIELLKILNTTDPYKGSIETRTDNTASPAVPIVAYSNINDANPIGAIMNTIAYDDFNDRLYAGGEDGVFLYMNEIIPNLIEVTRLAFTGNAPSVETANETFYILSNKQPRRAAPNMTDPPLDLALDVVNRNTLWAATVGGIYRSVNNGMGWSLSPFGEGSGVNSRAILIDPTNTVNILAGSEDGLYRTTNAGTAWKRIRSGLGNHKTVTSLIQAAGIAGARRKVWVGTPGGVFMGRQSLDLE